MERLVYAPKAYVFTKDSTGSIYNLTNYITAGNVNRQLDQVSTAQVTLRNPKKKFTTPSAGVAFHPQDPITIYLQRHQGYPVRVFTGYLDDTPYYQLYPGVITLQASCTLKRLQYSYFDPSLPYMIAFFQKYGWTSTGTGSLVANQAWNAKEITTQSAVEAGAKPFTDLQDGSLGKLLWATLYDIGQWQDANIFVEDLPTGPNGIAARMSTLMQSMQQAQKQASTDFTTFMESIIGTGTQGSGGGNTGGGNNSGGGNVTTGGLSGTRWRVIASAESLGGTGCDSIPIQSRGYSELSTDPVGGSPDFAALGSIPCHTPMMISNPANGKTVTVNKQDNGAGSTFNGPSSGYPVMGLYPDTVKDLGLGSNPFTIEIQRADGKPLTPVRGKLLTDVKSIKTSNTTGNNPRGVATQKQSGNANGGTFTTGFSTASTTTATTANTIDFNANVATTNATSTSVSRTQAMLNAAQAINDSKLPYVYAGGHAKIGTPNKGFDCSGAVAAVLAAAGAGLKMGGSVGSDADIISTLQSQHLIQPGPGQGDPEVTLWDNSGVHIFMSINGKYFGTSDGGGGGGGGGAWLNDGHSDTSSFRPYHFAASYLNQTVTYTAPNVSAKGAGAPSANVPTTPFTMYDATAGSLNTIPANPAAVASYVDGYGGYSASVTMFPNAQHLSITAREPPSEADCIDLEPGCCLNSSAAPWVKQMIAKGHNQPCIYTSTGNWPAVKKLLDAAGLQRSEYRWWAAHWTGSAHIEPGADATQWTNQPANGTKYDTSLCAPTFLSGVSSSAGGNGGGTSGGQTSSQAFVAALNFPSVEDEMTAISLGAEGKGLMHDQSLLPFIQQITQASLRSFQSLPNGDFYAFYPDYFGEMGTKPPYWLIEDIEILSGGINLTDAPLATHSFAVGDNQWPASSELLNQLFSAGTITVYNAFLGQLVDTKTEGVATASTPIAKSKKGKGSKVSPASSAKSTKATPPATSTDLTGTIMTLDEAVKFVERYGARPLVKDYPMVRSAIFEMLLAYQQFLSAWAAQFETPFTFTFMPEVFPGGKVAFPNHGLQMYVKEVVHQWDYSEGGFTTVATLSAPAIYGKTNPDLPPNMVQAMVEPLRSSPPGQTNNGDLTASGASWQSVQIGGQGKASLTTGNNPRGVAIKSTQQKKSSH